ncbi:MAG: TonB-dependent receptor [Prevotellaceae bacterium]|jgi:outer membrane receptor for ferrienterochelin and colicin|nr:TonB-dependent receptor [Prevotellaceae bacterium]
MRNMKTGIFISAVFFCCAVSLSAQNFVVSGYVRDAETKETLVGANVYETVSGKGCSANAYGFYSLTLKKNGTKKTIHYSLLGYETASVRIDFEKDTAIQIYLKPASEQLREIVVSNKAKLRDLRLGVVEIPVSQIKSIPALFGETDLMKSLQFIPGVQNTSEGKSDLSVRGGSPDQNLILLDGVPVYNPNHVFGFLSIFNTDALKKVTLYKSSFPARFGGRLSSVTDIVSKDGHKEKFSGSASLGLPTLKFNIEGPIIKDKTSFVFSMRRTYLDLVMNIINKTSESGTSSNFFFHDINAKIHRKIDDKTSVYLSIYNGNDKLKQTTADIENKQTGHKASTQEWDWGNTIVSGKLSRALTSNFFFKTTLIYNQYHYKVNTDDEYQIPVDSTTEQKVSKNFLFSSGIKDYSLYGDFEYFPVSDHDIKFGTALTCHDFNPEVISLTTKSDTVKKSDNTPKQTRSKELALYAEDDWDMSENMKLNAGLRFSLFNVNEKTYTAIDPRLSLSFTASEKLSLQAGYSFMQQYVHLLSSNSIVLQTDLWVPVTGKIKPMQSTQYSFGVFYELPKTVFLSFETYYKDMKNVIEYRDGINYSGVSAGWENKVESGVGRSYGIEFSVEKKEGRITGTASYTLSKSERKFNEINFGEWFPAKYDRRHVINVLMNCKLNKKFDFTAIWTYHSGNRITLPTMTHVNPKIVYPLSIDNEFGIENLMELDHRNNYKMDNYHRLDLSVNYTFAKKRNRYCMLNLSIYNVYNQKNPYRIIIESDMHKSPENESIYTHKLKQVTLFPIIPSLSFTYHF